MTINRGGNIIGGDESEPGLDWLPARAGDERGTYFAVGCRGKGFPEAFATVGEGAEIKVPIRILGSQRRRGYSTSFGSRQRVLKFIEGDKNTHREKFRFERAAELLQLRLIARARGEFPARRGKRR